MALILNGTARVHPGRLPRPPKLERFPAKWMPVRVKKTRQNKEIEPPFRFNRNGKGSSAKMRRPGNTGEKSREQSAGEALLQRRLEP
jgi:hypothetical protein